MMDCLFCKIVNGQIPSNILYQDDMVIAFNDIDPKAPVHSLIIPRTHIATINDLTTNELPIVGHMIDTAKNLAKTFKLAQQGYRLVMNCNADGGQSVYHIHLHLLGGRIMAWPPG